MEKAELMNYRALVLEVRHLRSYLASLEELRGTVASPQLSVTPKGPPVGRSSVEVRAGRFVDAEALYREKLSLLEGQMLRVERAVGSLDNPAERLIMRMRYLDGKEWASICVRLQFEGYSERQVYRLHGYALMKLKEREAQS